MRLSGSISKLVCSFLLASVCGTLHAEISREQFIDQLDSANCSNVPTNIYLDTEAPDYDLANALSLSWISLTTLDDQVLSNAELAQQWGITNPRIIENATHDLKILIADYQDTTLVTFRHTDSNKNWLYNADYGLWDNAASFTLGEQTHHGFTRMLSAEWTALLTEVRRRSESAGKLMVFGHSLGAALAQLSAAGFEAEGLHVDQVYLTGAPKVGSDAWTEKAEALLSGRVHRLIYENDLIAHLPVHNDALDEFRSIFSIVPDFIANSIGGVRANMVFDSLGITQSLNRYGQLTAWSQSDAGAVEEIYWLNMSDDLAEAKHSSWNPITQVQNMAGVVTNNLQNHLLRSDDGYFCAMISALEQE